MKQSRSIFTGGVPLLAWLVLIGVGGPARGQNATPLPTALATNYLPSDASFAVLIRPALLAVPESMQPVVDAVDEILKPAKLGISVADIEEFKFVAVGEPDMMRGPPDFYMVVRAKRAVDWKRAVGGPPPQEEKVNGRTLYVHDPKTVRPDALWLPDKRTLVIGSREAVVRTTTNPDPNDHAGWWGDWEKAAKSPLAGFLHKSWLDVMRLPGPDGKPDDSLQALGKDVTFAVLTGNVTDKGFAVEATISTRSNEGSQRVAPVVSRNLTNFANLIVEESGLTSGDAERLSEQLSRLLSRTQIITERDKVEIRALLPPSMIQALAESVRLMGQ